MSVMGAIEFGQLIRSARLRRGWQQQELADRIGVDRGYISAIENGKRNWPQSYIAPLSTTLALSQIDMAVAAGLITVQERPERQESDPVTERISAVVSEWPIEQRQAFLRWIESRAAELDTNDPPIAAAADDASEAS